MDAVNVKDLTFSYDGEKETIQNISFSIPKGSYTTIIGQNGSGKSTIAKLLIGFRSEIRHDFYFRSTFNRIHRIRYSKSHWHRVPKSRQPVYRLDRRRRHCVRTGKPLRSPGANAGNH